MRFYEFPIESLVVVSSPKKITAEWRYVVANGEIVTSSQYIERGAAVSRLAIDDAALGFARTVAAVEYQPDPVWVLDVCRTEDGGYHLLGIGGFSFASLYGCDRDEVPTFCVTLVAASLVGQVFLARNGNLLPFFRAWLIGGSIAAFVYPLDFVRTDAYDPPSGMSYVAAFIGCLIAGFWSLAEGRSFWNGTRDFAKPHEAESG